MKYWLMKCEPGAYSIEDLKRDDTTSWEGVRNYQASNTQKPVWFMVDVELSKNSNKYCHWLKSKAIKLWKASWWPGKARDFQFNPFQRLISKEFASSAAENDRLNISLAKTFLNCIPHGFDTFQTY